jgi:hypothetical protein
VEIVEHIGTAVVHPDKVPAVILPLTPRAPTPKLVTSKCPRPISISKVPTRCSTRLHCLNARQKKLATIAIKNRPMMVPARVVLRVKEGRREREQRETVWRLHITRRRVSLTRCPLRRRAHRVGKLVGTPDGAVDVVEAQERIDEKKRERRMWLPLESLVASD